MASIGIDLGSTNCCAAIALCDSGMHIRTLSGNEGQPQVPSVLTLKRRNTLLKREFGQMGLNAAPANVIFDAIRVNSSYSSGDNSPPLDAARIFAERDHFAKYTLHIGQSGREECVRMTQTEAIAAILGNLKHTAEQKLGSTLDQAVLSVPSFAGQAHRQMLKDAASVAGFPRVQLINQSTAAAIAYSVHEGDTVHGQVAILAMGARTTECSVFEFHPGQSPQLLRTAGYADFGGEHFTAALAEWALNELRRRDPDERAALRERLHSNNVDEQTKREFKRDLRAVCEAAKCELEHSNELRFMLDLDKLGGDSHTFELTRDAFFEQCQPVQPLHQLLAAVLHPHREGIRRVLLVGGSTRLPIVPVLLGQLLPAVPIVPFAAILPELAVLTGAAYKASALEARHRISAGTRISRVLEQALLFPEFAYTDISVTAPSGTIFVTIRTGTALPARSGPISSTYASAHFTIESDQRRSLLGSVQLFGGQCFCVSVDQSGLISCPGDGSDINMAHGDLLEREKQPFLLDKWTLKDARQALYSYYAELARCKHEDEMAAERREEARREQRRAELEAKRKEEEAEARRLEQEKRAREEAAARKEVLRREQEKQAREEEALKAEEQRKADLEAKWAVQAEAPLSLNLVHQKRAREEAAREKEEQQLKAELKMDADDAEELSLLPNAEKNRQQAEAEPNPENRRQTGAVETKFQFKQRSEGAVKLCITNGRVTKTILMKRVEIVKWLLYRPHTFECIIPLPPGCYSYWYQVDGRDTFDGTKTIYSKSTSGGLPLHHKLTVLEGKGNGSQQSGTSI